MSSNRLRLVSFGFIMPSYIKKEAAEAAPSIALCRRLRHRTESMNFSNEETSVMFLLQSRLFKQI